jgi:hypothetical protein
MLGGVVVLIKRFGRHSDLLLVSSTVVLVVEIRLYIRRYIIK